MNTLSINLPRYCLIWTTLFFITGISITNISGIHTQSLPFFPLLFTASLVCLFLSIILRTTVSCYLFFFLVTLLLGYYHAIHHLRLPTDPDHIISNIKQKREAVLFGTISEMITHDDQFSRTVLELETILFKEDKSPRHCTGKVALTLAGSWPSDILPGDNVMIRGTVRRPKGVQTPGVFNFETYLAQKGIFATAFIQSKVLILKDPANQSSWTSPRIQIEKLRYYIGTFLDAHLPADASGLYRAILIGDKSALRPEILEIFKKCGTMHILAISGLHLTVIGGLLYLLLRRILSRSQKLTILYTLRKPALTLTLPFLLIYAFLAGAQPPVIRALVMSSCVILAVCTGQTRHSFSLLALAALIILLIDPVQLHSLSFLLSFTAVTAILLALPYLTTTRGEKDQPAARIILRWFIAGLFISLATTLATLPITLYGFNRVSFIGPIANLIFEPLICLWSLPLGIGALFIHLINTHLAQLILSLGAQGLLIAANIGQMLSNIPYCDVQLPGPSFLQILLYAAGFILLALYRRLNCWCIFCGAGFLFSALVLYIFPHTTLPKPNKNRDLVVNFLDVGQGSASLIELPSGLNVLIDGGSSSFSKGNLGLKVLAPFLWQKKIRTLDAVIITHPDADHFNGLDFVFSHFPTSLVWVLDATGHNKDYSHLIHRVKQMKIPLVIPETGARMGNRSDYLEVLYCGKVDSAEKFTSMNNNSLVIKVCSNNVCLLFPGDIEEPIEKYLVSSAVDLKADILLSPHHGSSTSNSERFLKNIAPEFVVVSSGRWSSRFPSPELIERTNKTGTPLFSTAANGTLTLRADSQSRITWSGYRHHNQNPLLKMEHYQLW